MKIILLVFILYGFHFQRRSNLNAHTDFYSSEDTSLLNPFYDSLCRIKADSILFVHIRNSIVESKAIFSWKIDDELFGQIFRIENLNIYTRKNVDSMSLLIKARNLYFSTEKSFADTIHNARSPASHEFWVAFKSNVNKKESVHFVNSTDVVFGPYNSMTRVTGMFFDVL